MERKKEGKNRISRIFSTAVHNCTGRQPANEEAMHEEAADADIKEAADADIKKVADTTKKKIVDAAKKKIADADIKKKQTTPHNKGRKIQLTKTTIFSKS